MISSNSILGMESLDFAIFIFFLHYELRKEKKARMRGRKRSKVAKNSFDLKLSSFLSLASQLSCCIFWKVN